MKTDKAGTLIPVIDVRAMKDTWPVTTGFVNLVTYSNTTIVACDDSRDKAEHLFI